MPVEVTKWMARDGTYHGSQEEATEYEEGKMIQKDLREFLRNALPRNSVGLNNELMEIIFLNRIHLIKILKGDHN